MEGSDISVGVGYREWAEWFGVVSVVTADNMMEEGLGFRV